MTSLTRWFALMALGLGMLGVFGCEEPGKWYEADSNPGTETPTSGNATLLIHVDGQYLVNIYLDQQYIGSLQSGQSRNWSIPSGHHECEGRNAEDSYSPTGWSFDVEPGQTEERWVRFVHK